MDKLANELEKALREDFPPVEVESSGGALTVKYRLGVGGELLMGQPPIKFNVNDAEAFEYYLSLYLGFYRRLLAPLKVGYRD